MIIVAPIEDIDLHDWYSTSCPCRPEVDTDGELIVIHSSYDHREDYEHVAKSPSGWLVFTDDEPLPKELEE